MKVYTNTARLKQKQRIGGAATLLGTLVLLAALLVARNPTNAPYAWLLSLAGLLVTLVGTYHVNRWVRPPLPHLLLEQALRRLDGRHLLFNHVGAVPHLLLTPKGLVAIRAKRYEGPVAYDGPTARWRGKTSLRRLYMQGLTPERLGDPGEEVTQARNAVLAWLQRRLPDVAEEVPVAGIAFFVAPKTTLNVAEPPVPLAQPDSVKKVVQGLFVGERPLPHAVYKRLRAALEAEASAARAGSHDG